MMNYTDFCKQWLSSWTGNRPQELIKFYAEDAFYLDPANPKGLKGHEQMTPYFTRLLSKNPSWRWEAVEIIPTEKGFTLKWKATIPTGNFELTLFGLDIVEVEANLITRNEVYFDRVPWLEKIAEEKKRQEQSFLIND